MIAFSLLSLFFVTHALGQDIVYDSAHNVTSIVGTWSSGSQNVVTGAVSISDDPPVSHVVYTHIPDRASHNPPTNRSSTQLQLACHIHCELIRDVERRKLRWCVYSSSDGYYEIARYRMTGNGNRLFSFLCLDRLLTSSTPTRHATQLHHRRHELVSRHLRPRRQRFHRPLPLGRRLPTNTRPLCARVQLPRELQRYGALRAVEYLPGCGAGVYPTVVSV